ncbi:MAG: TlyA family RNA methyltransferase [Armatimonadota bacterium]|nr:TlyA family RNA methyltransferase [bacterium]MDW8320710.1 TlyA family RNA methyltransferase [Armatimonadota bacterium]
MRLDRWLVEHGLVESREKGQELIRAGAVLVDGQPVTKPATPVKLESVVTLLRQPKYVGRGGEKLEAALQRWKVNVQGIVCADVGACTGGFTDCLLQHGALKVYAIEAGHGQLHPRLQADSRVISLENTDARNLSVLPELVNLVVVDVSFVSLKAVLPALFRWLKQGGEVWALLKPQFEAPHATKRGVVRSAQVRERVLQEFVEWCRAQGWEVLDAFECPLAGEEGNREFWLRLREQRRL